MVQGADDGSPSSDGVDWTALFTHSGEASQMRRHEVGARRPHEQGERAEEKGAQQRHEDERGERRMALGQVEGAQAHDLRRSVHDGHGPALRAAVAVGDLVVV